MPPCYAWVLNLEAELELANGAYNPGARLAQQLQKFVPAASSLLGPHDVSVQQLDPERRSSYVGRCWCPTPRAIAALRAAGTTPEIHPDAATLRKVNHRAFAHHLGRGLIKQALITDEETLADVLADTSHPWLLKRPLAFAGRGQQRVLGTIDEGTRAWIKASLRSDALIVEPFVSLLAEFSLHGFLWPDGQYQGGRVCLQSVSERGVFRNVRLAQEHELASHERAAFEEALNATAEALGEAGYFGPFGIDGYRYRAHGSNEEAFCALSEINARYTMGFVTGFPIHPSALHLRG